MLEYSVHLGPGKRRPRVARQRGIYTLLISLVLGMALSALGVLAVGHNVWQKGQMQGVADLVALTAAKQIADWPQFTQALETGRANGLLNTDTATIQCIINGAVVNNCDDAVAVRVTVSRRIPSILPFFNSSRVTSVLAEATVAPLIVGSVGSGLLNLNTQQSALLNGLLTGLGGGNVNLSVAQYGSLLGAKVNVDLLALKTELGALTMDELLKLRVSAFKLLDDSLRVGTGSSSDKAQVKGVLSLLGNTLNRVNFTLGDLVAADLGMKDNTALNVNLGQLAQVALLKSVQGQSYVLPIQSGLLNLDVGVRILEAPQIFVGQKMPNRYPVVTAKTAQVALDVRIRQLLNLNLLLIQLSALDLGLQLRVAGGNVQVDDLRCHYPRADNEIDITVVPAVAELCLADSASNLNTTVGSLQCGPPANILTATLLGLIQVGVKLGASLSVRNNPESFTFQGVAPMSKTVKLSLGQSLGNLLGNLKLNLVLDVPLVGPLLSGVVNGLLSTLLSVLAPVISPILALVGGILDGLLAVLGINLNEVTINADQFNCAAVRLTR